MNGTKAAVQALRTKRPLALAFILTAGGLLRAVFSYNVLPIQKEDLRRPMFWASLALHAVVMVIFTVISAYTARVVVTLGLGWLTGAPVDLWDLLSNPLSYEPPPEELPTELDSLTDGFEYA